MAHGRGQHPNSQAALNAHRPCGRPPRRYSITSALAELADEPYGAAEDGTMLTRAQCAARWVWERATTGLDDSGVPLNIKDRADCIKIVLDRTEPTAALVKQWDRQGEGGDGDTPGDEAMIAAIEKLTDEELAVLNKLTDRAGGGK